MTTAPSGALVAGRRRQSTRGRANATTPEHDNSRIQRLTPDSRERPPTKSEKDSPKIVLTFGAQLTPFRPSTARYRQLLAMLTEAQLRAEAGGDMLAHSLYALVGVLDFLGEDPFVIRQSLDRLLHVLANAVNDLCIGAKPALFLRKDRKPGRPKNDTVQGALGALAACVDIFVAAGRSRKDAAHFVVTEAKRLGITVRDKSVTVSAVLRVRDEMNGGRASKLAQDVYREIYQRRSALSTAMGNPAIELREATELVRGSLKKVRGMGF
jgi:hypothetical protein